MQEYDSSTPSLQIQQQTVHYKKQQKLPSINPYTISQSIFSLLHQMGFPKVSSTLSQQANLIFNSNHQLPSISTINHSNIIPELNLHEVQQQSQVLKIIREEGVVKETEGCKQLILAQMMKTIYLHKETHTLPTYKVFQFESSYKIKFISIQQQTHQIAFIDTTNKIIVLQKDQIKAQQKEQLNSSLTSLSWITQNTIVTGNSKGELKIWLITNNLTIYKKIVSNQSSIKSIISERRRIYSYANKQMSIIKDYRSNEPGNIDSFIVPSYIKFLKPLNTNLIIGLQSKKRVSVFDMHLKSCSILCDLQNGMLMDIMFDESSKVIYLMVNKSNESFIELWRMNGCLLKRVRVKMTKDEMKSFGALRIMQFDLQKQIFLITGKISSQIIYYGLRSQTIIHHYRNDKEENEMVKPIKHIQKLSTNQIVILTDHTITIYSTIKKELKLIKKYRQPIHRHIFSNLTQDLAILIRALRDRNPQALHLNFMFADNDNSQDS